METPVTVTRFEVKSHASADEVRTPAKTRVEIVRLEGLTLGRFIFEPGWRWSECIKPVVKTDSCQISHAGHVVSGRLTVRMKDGTRRRSAPANRIQSRPGTTPGSRGTRPSSALKS